MSRQTLLNSTVKHVVENFGIFGFGSEETALLQSVKELLENSLDACRSSISLTNPSNKNISVSIKEIDSVSCAVEVSDDGCGVSDALSILKVFCSTKDGSNASLSPSLATGRFGVGLSTCLVYSLVNCGAPMRMVSKCKGADSATVADYTLDRTGQPVCTQSRSIDTLGGFASGTRIRVVLPLSRDRPSVVQRVCRTVESYLVLLDCLPTSCVQIDLRADVAGYSYSFHTSGHTPTTTTTPSATTTPPNDPLATTYAQRYVHYLAGTECTHCTSVVVGEEVQVKVVLVLLRDTVERDSGTTDALPLTIHRYSNHTPLLDYSQDPLSCSVVSSVRVVKWGEYGYKLRMGEGSSSVGRVEVMQTTTATSHASYTTTTSITTNTTANTTNTTNTTSTTAATTTLWRCPQWELVCSRPEVSNVVQQGGVRAVVAVDVVCDKVPFANMRKTCLSSDHPAIPALITQGVTLALQRMEQADDPPGLFVNKRQYKEQQLRVKYLPSVANCIASMVMLSKDEAYIGWVQDALEVPDSTSTGGSAGSDVSTDGSGGSATMSKAALVNTILQRLTDVLKL